MSSPSPAVPGAGELTEPVQPPGTAARRLAAPHMIGRDAPAPARSTPSESSGAPVLPEIPCPSCAQPFTGKFCAECGERRPTPADLSLRRFLGEAVAVLTSADSVLLRTVGTLVRRPGALTAAYLAGARTRYLPPLRLFLVVNVVYFFAVLWTGDRMFTTPLTVYMRYWPFDLLLPELVGREIAARGTTFEEYAQLFNASLQSHASTLVITMVPLTALLFHLLYLRSRRYYVEHLVFSLHFLAAFLLVWPVAVLGQYGVYIAASGLGVSVGPTGLVLVQFYPVFLAGGYLYAAMLRVYGEGRARTALKAVLATFGWGIIVLSAYRFVLFFAAFHSI